MKPILAFIVAAVLLAGCSTPPDRVAFNTLKSSEIAATDGLKAWANYCRSVESTPSRVTLGTHMKVKAAYDAYKASAVVAADAFIEAKSSDLPARDWTVLTEDMRKALATFLKAIQEAERK